MGISINTSQYIKTKSVEIDGIAFEIRPMTSAETLSLSQMQKDMEKTQKLSKNEQAEKAIDILDKIKDLYFGLYDKPKEAMKLLEKLPFDSWFDIYNQVMTGESDG